jgi:hypothetical protein
MQIVEPLRRAIPEEIRQKLRETTPRRGQDGQVFDAPKYDGYAAVVLLRPDVMVLTIRPTIEAKEFVHAFADFLWEYSEPPRRRQLDRRVELIGCEEETLLGFRAGTLLPYSDEMYLVTTEPGPPSRRLTFNGNVAVVEVGGVSLRFTRLRSGTDVLAEFD